MASPAQATAPLTSPATEIWWSTFLDAQGRDSEEEAGFLGFLHTNGIPAASSPDVLQTAYSNFVTFMEESAQRQADLGPDRATLAAERAKAEIEQRFVAKSRVSAVGVEKPLTAATRPEETRQPLQETGPGPSGEAQLAPATGEEPQQHPQVQAGPTQPNPAHASDPTVTESGAPNESGVEPSVEQPPVGGSESRGTRSGRRSGSEE